MSSVSNFVDCVIIISGLALCVKKFVQMERFHEVRVIVFITILSLSVILYFLMYAFTLGSIFWIGMDNQF